MKISIILMSVIILSIFSISNILAQSSNNTLRECVDLYMDKLDQSKAELEQKIQQKPKENLNESTTESPFFKEVSTEACITSYAETGKFGQLLSAEDQDKYITLALQKIVGNLTNQDN